MKTVMAATNGKEHCISIQYVLIHKLFTLGKVGTECHPSIRDVEFSTLLSADLKKQSPLLAELTISKLIR